VYRPLALPRYTLPKRIRMLKQVPVLWRGESTGQARVESDRLGVVLPVT
jgi:hypothetical protein